MGGWLSLLLAYVLGGVTFIPLVIVATLAYTYYSSPYRPDVDPSRAADGKTGQDAAAAAAAAGDSIVQPGDDTSALDDVRRDASEKHASASEYLDVASGYFAVCREYTPMGINAKPIERPTPVGSTTVAAPSPSVYQSMYRSIFERKGPAGPVDNNSMNQRPKRAGNVFYLVLRHGHLMLFDDEEQIEVRHVISLAHHHVSIYSGGDVTPEGELFIKRNALCLARKRDGGEASDTKASRPFYLFSENCSAKEDFYFALIKNQEQMFGATTAAPKPKNFQVNNIISLVQKLHSTEENIHSRWLNAMLGRIFLAIHRTHDMEAFISDKITKKISRVKRPSFLSNVHIRKIDTGDAAPYFTNWKLRDLSVDGECVTEADVKYTGNFRIEVATAAKIDLGGRFRAREVNLVLSVVLRKIEGHVLFKIKPPPSNRIWLSFQTMPKMEMTIEPIVSSRQITYALIIRQIENRIKEVLAETLVQPFWDDVPFFRTEHKQWRGGIFEGDDAVDTSEEDPATVLAQAGDVDGVQQVEENPDALRDPRPLEKSSTAPLPADVAQTSGTGLFGRKLGKNASSSTSSTPAPAAASTGVEPRPAPATAAPSPKTLNHAPEPVVGTDAAHADIFKPSSSPQDHATSYMAALHSRSREGSPAVTPAGSPEKPSYMPKRPSISSVFSTESKNADKDKDSASDKTPIPPGRRNTSSSVDSASLRGGPSSESLPITSTGASSTQEQAGSPARNFLMRREGSNISATSFGSDGNLPTQKKNTLAAMSNAATQARQWGWNAIQRQKGPRKDSDAASQVDLSQPMGRGQPLPPPGTPLPGPTNGKKRVTPAPAPRRKPVAPAQTPSGMSSQESITQPATIHSNQRRRRGESNETVDDGGENMLVVAAPDESDLETPGLQEGKELYLEPTQETSEATGGGAEEVVLPTFTPETQASTPPTDQIPIPICLSRGDDASNEDNVRSEDRSSSAAMDIPKPRSGLERAPKTPSVHSTESPAVSASDVSHENDGNNDDEFSGWMEYDDDEEIEPTLEKDAAETTPFPPPIAQEVKQ